MHIRDLERERAENQKEIARLKKETGPNSPNVTSGQGKYLDSRAAQNNRAAF